MNPENPNDILNALQTIITTTGNTPVANTPIPGLNFTMPTGGDIQSQYKTFLQEASQDPNLINYYNQLLAYAKGDTEIAIQQLKTDYSTGTRQVMDTLKNSLAQLGLTFTGEQQNLLDTLNKRGIALTQGPDGKLTYAGGGESATELGRLNQSEQLRQEAQKRSAQQGIENAGLTLNKGITNANEALQNQAISLNQAKTTDITNRANMNFINWQNKQNMDAQLALYNQNKNQQGGGGGTPRSHINPATGVWDDNYFAGT